MAAQANIVINDGKATPVAHTFLPVSGGNGLFAYRENVASLSMIGQGTVKARVIESKSGLSKVNIVLELPALEVTSGQNAAGYTAAPKVGYSHKIDINCFLPDRGTTDQRKDLRVLFKNLLDNQQIVDMIENLVSPT